jgi:hypothetical protein
MIFSPFPPSNKTYPESTLGIEGKRALWLALAAVAQAEPTLRVLDYERLARWAQEQRRRVEALRLATAKRALKAS